MAQSTRLALSLLFAYVLAFFVTGCATPIAPSGGPTDQTPPRLIASLPEAGALRVETDELRLAFSEDVNAGSVQRALSIVPAFDAPLDIDVRRDEIRIRFPEPLRDSTTYVVTLGTDLQDLRSVKLSAPITLAFSTGDQLDAARIEGTLRDPVTGRGVADVNVFAYALASDTVGTDAFLVPDPRSATPSYQTQTGSDGRFAFAYLRPGPFFVAAVADANRSGTADAGEAFAAPPDSVTLADTVDLPALDLFYVQRDTVGPEIRSVRSASNRRFAVRFDESVRLTSRTPGAWSVTDTTTGTPATVEAVYQTPDVPQQVWLVTDPRAVRPHWVALLDSTAVVDSTGNPAQGRSVFTPSSAPDTVQARVAAFLPFGAERDTIRALRPGERPGLRFTRPADATLLAQIRLEPSDLALTDVELDGVSYRVSAVPTTGPISITAPWADSSRTLRFTVPTAADLGELAGTVLRDSLVSDAPLLVELYAEDATKRLAVASANENGAFRFDQLPEGAYRLRLIVDLDGDGAWTGGRLAPYEAPEPLDVLRGTERVRPRWETVVDTLRFGAQPAPALVEEEERQQSEEG